MNPRIPLLVTLALPLLPVLGVAQGPPPGFRVETVTRGVLDQACTFAFAPDGRLFVLERVTGNIRVIANGAVGGTWATIPNAGSDGSEQGLLGIAIDPDFLRNGFVYVYYTRTTTTTHNVVARLQEMNGAGTQLTVISPEIPSMSGHNGGRMVFGHDGKLYVGTGDGQVPVNAQNLGSAHGKILRMNAPDGSATAGNPFVGLPGALALVWSYGHRNQFGLAVHPVTGLLYQTENGEQLEDEVNRIVKGGNYGWPLYEGREPVPDPSTEDPLLTFAPTPDPTGTCFYTGPLYPAEYRNAWFICRYSFGQLNRLDLDASGTVVLQDFLFMGFPGRIFDVADGPDGNLWVLRNDSALRGANQIDRFLHDPAPVPSANLAAVSNKVVGGSITLCFVGGNGDMVIAWIGASIFGSPTPTPFGDLWVPLDIVLPGLTITADNRVYLGIPVDDVNLIGVTVHLQAVTYGSTGLKLTNPDSLVLR